MKVLGTKKVLVACTALAALGLAASVAFTGNSNALFSIQGRLTDTNGVPVTGSHSFEVSFYSAASGGTLYYRESFASVNVQNGIYNLLLGDNPSTGTLSSLFANADLWMGLRVDGGSELSPRTHAAYTGGAHRAVSADNIGNMTASMANVLVGGPTSDASALHTHGGAKGGPIWGKFRGVSSSNSYGYNGITYLNSLCNNTFSGTRMCTTFEIMHADTGPISIPQGYAWVHVRPQEGLETPGSGNYRFMGPEGFHWCINCNNVNCGSWSQSGWYAPVINGSGQIGNREWNFSGYCNNQYNVACCDNSGL
jgi:hypothetical protein